MAQSKFVEMLEPKFAIKKKLGEYKIVKIDYKNLDFKEVETINLNLDSKRIIDSELQINTSFNSSPYADYLKGKPKEFFKKQALQKLEEDLIKEAKACNANVIKLDIKSNQEGYSQWKINLNYQMLLII